ncbi:MAG: 50S ribosomal protein L3 [Candidatus Micrarchaeota archaeon]|nr:50S ribosomal protein L3 [Candidatus Micrarchaeota archaeon]MDE1823827.1 50S ribosomal protein L3 [Candidatus Micrarchaeota archaeon]MDE1849483.1 50S ribosomal protein L3 [Candidatus Micrarchaeota archaeon]
MRKGSLEYWPHRRAKAQMPRIRTWQNVAEPGFLGFVGFKAGMTHVAMVDDTNSPAKGTEVMKPVTVLEMPKIYIYGMRTYKKRYEYIEPDMVAYDKELAKRVGIKDTKNADISRLKEQKDAVNVRALAFIDPAELGIANKRIRRFEMGVGGKDVQERIAFIEKWMGKELKISDVIGTGDYIDVKSITKGKGWAGVIKRFGVARGYRKATGKIRHLGVLGAWHPAKVLYTVPHSGHMGYNYRLERNKRVLKMGTAKDAPAINVSGGFVNYGSVKNDFVVLQGSIPGPAKRLVRIRKALRNKKAKKEPQINYISTASKQGS